MRKMLAMLLAIIMIVGCTPALAAYNDHTDYVDWPIVEEGSMTVSVVASRHETNGVDAEDQWWWVWSEKFTGIDFEVEQILSSAVTERKSLMLASGDIPDMIWAINVSDSEMVRYGMGEGLFLDLTPYMTEEIMPYLSAWNKAYPEGIAYATTPDGAVYSFPAYIDYFILSAPGGDLSINSIYKEELGWEKDPANIDELVKYLYEVKAKHPELYPLGGSKESANPMKALVNAFGFVQAQSGDTENASAVNGLRGAEKWTGDEKEFVLPILDPRFKEVVALMNQFYKDGIIEPEFFTMTSTQLLANYEAEKYAVAGDAGWQGLTNPELFQKWTMMKTLTGPYTTTPRIGMDLKAKHGFVMLNADIEPEKAEAICRWLDFLYSDLGGMYVWCGPASTSSDTIGMIGGYTADENGAAKWYDKDGNEVTSSWQMSGHSAAGGGGSQIIGNRSHPLQDTEAFANGVTNRPEMRNWYYNNSLVPYGYDPNWGNGWYMRTLKDAVEPYRVDSTPHVMYFDEETTLEIDDLLLVLGSTANSEIAKFITGKRDLAEWDNFVADMKAMGAEDLYNYYKEQYDAYQANKAQ